MPIISLAEMLAKLTDGETRDYEFWQNVVSSFVHKSDAMEAPVVIEVDATMVSQKRLPVAGGMTAFPNSVILVDGVPLINTIGREEYILTSFGISEGADRSFSLGERVVVFKKA